MSALTPHLRVLRALAIELHGETDKLETRAKIAERDDPRLHAESNGYWIGYHIVKAIQIACTRAAGQLEDEEAALKPPREGLDEEITYNPKGKPKS